VVPRSAVARPGLAQVLSARPPLNRGMRYFQYHTGLIAGYAAVVSA